MTRTHAMTVVCARARLVARVNSTSGQLSPVAKVARCIVVRDCRTRVLDAIKQSDFADASGRSSFISAGDLAERVEFCAAIIYNNQTAQRKSQRCRFSPTVANSANSSKAAQLNRRPKSSPYLYLPVHKSSASTRGPQVRVLFGAGYLNIEHLAPGLVKRLVDRVDCVFGVADGLVGRCVSLRVNWLERASAKATGA